MCPMCHPLPGFPLFDYPIMFGLYLTQLRYALFRVAKGHILACVLRSFGLRFEAYC